MKGFGVPIAIVLSAVAPVSASLQRADTLIVDGVVYALHEMDGPLMNLPLELLWRKSQTRPQLSPSPGGGWSSDRWRGCTAIYEVMDEALYLRGLDAWHGKDRASLKTIFPEECQNGKVKASWYTGLLRVSTGFYPMPTVMRFQLPFREGSLIPQDQKFTKRDPYDPDAPPMNRYLTK